MKCVRQLLLWVCYLPAIYITSSYSTGWSRVEAATIYAERPRATSCQCLKLIIRGDVFDIFGDLDRQSHLIRCRFEIVMATL